MPHLPVCPTKVGGPVVHEPPPPLEQVRAGVEANSRRADIYRAIFLRAGVIVGAVVAIFRLLD